MTVPFDDLMTFRTYEVHYAPEGAADPAAFKGQFFGFVSPHPGSNVRFMIFKIDNGRYWRIPTTSITAIYTVDRFGVTQE